MLGLFIKRTFRRPYMLLLWAGAIVMGLTYLVGFGATKESLSFVVGQVVLGVLGLLREYQIALDAFDGERRASGGTGL